MVKLIDFALMLKQQALEQDSTDHIYTIKSLYKHGIDVDMVEGDVIFYIGKGSDMYNDITNRKYLLYKSVDLLNRRICEITVDKNDKRKISEDEKQKVVYIY